jgi:uncharacterized protein (DUF302 family)
MQARTGRLDDPIVGNSMGGPMITRTVFSLLSSLIIVSFSTVMYGGGEVVMTDKNSRSTDDPGIVTIKSPLTFSQTVERLKLALQSHGIKVFAVIDQQAEARTVGLDMPPMVLILFGNPKAGTPLMLSQPLSGLDLPLKLLVSEAKAGEVLVSFNSTQYILKRHALPDRLGSNIAPAERLIAAALSE